MKQTAVKSLVCMLVLFWSAGSASAVILHPAGEPNLATWTDRPAEDVVGRFGSNASCVAVSSNCVLAVRHGGGGVGTQVNIAGRSYSVAQVWNHSTADLRIAKLAGANLANFVDIYADTNEIDKSIVMGGYGDGRAGLLQSYGVTYGYQWDNSSNTTRRFCTNKIEDTVADSNLAGFTSDIIIADFDGLGEGQSTVYEGAIADHDSGGGWFIKDGNDWQVAGLSRAVEHFEQSWFRDCNDPNVLDPDYVDAVRLSCYAQWLYDNIPDVLAGDLNGDDYVDFRDFAVFASFWLNTGCHAPDWCLGADFEPDGDVDWADLAEFAYNWLTP